MTGDNKYRWKRVKWNHKRYVMKPKNVWYFYEKENFMPGTGRIRRFQSVGGLMEAPIIRNGRLGSTPPKMKPPSFIQSLD